MAAPRDAWGLVPRFDVPWFRLPPEVDRAYTASSEALLELLVWRVYIACWALLPEQYDLYDDFALREDDRGLTATFRRVSTMRVFGNSRARDHVWSLSNLEARWARKWAKGGAGVPVWIERAQRVLHSLAAEQEIDLNGVRVLELWQDRMQFLSMGTPSEWAVPAYRYEPGYGPRIGAAVRNIWSGGPRRAGYKALIMEERRHFASITAALAAEAQIEIEGEGQEVAEPGEAEAELEAQAALALIEDDD